jgi:hypothetical protein
MTSRHPEPLRWIALAPFVLALGACSSDGASDWPALWTAAQQAWAGGESSVSLQQAGAVPYATLGVRIGGGPQQLLILATDNGDHRLWTSAAHVAIETRNGRITATAGLQQNLFGFISQSGANQSWMVAHEYQWTADFADIGRYSILVTCHDVPTARETIQILGKDFDTMRVEEDCNAAQLDWSYHNTFWVDALSGRVWRSRQFFHPKADPLELEILRPPASLG